MPAATKSSDVDSVIDLHRRRLEEHRRFLDGDSAAPYHSPQLEIKESIWRREENTNAVGSESPGFATSGMTNAANVNGAQVPNQSYNNEAATSSSVPRTPRTPSGGINHQQHSHTTTSTNEKNNSLGRHSPIERTSFEGTIHNNTSNELHHRAPPAVPALYQAGEKNANTSSTSRIPHHRYSSSYSPSPVEQQALRNGKYFTNSPTRMYERSQAWLANKERNLVDTYHEAYRVEDHECTFQPETHTAAYMASFQHHHYAPPSMIDVGEANFIERQRIARMLKDEANKKMLPDTSRWENRRTIPKEFELNKRDTAIPSLKRPIAAQTAQNINSTKPGRNKSYALSSSSVASSAPNTPRAVSPAASKTSKSHLQPFKAKSESGTVEGDEPFQPAARHGEGTDLSKQNLSAEELNRIKRLHTEEINELKETIRRQQDQIASLSHGLALAQRELVVARATIRDLSLNPQ